MPAYSPTRIRSRCVAGVRFIQPVDDTLGADTTSGTAQTLRFNLKHARQQRWRVGVQREVFTEHSVEVSYDWITRIARRSTSVQDYLPAQYWIPGSLNARDTAAQAALDANVPNPYNIANFASLADEQSDALQRIATNGFFTATTVPRNRLLRPFSQ